MSNFLYTDDIEHYAANDHLHDLTIITLLTISDILFSKEKLLWNSDAVRINAIMSRISQAVIDIRNHERIRFP